MNGIQFISKPLTWFMAALFAVVVAGCGGGSDTATALNSDKAFTSFTVGGAVGVINQTAKTIAITVPSGTVVTALAPTFTITGGVVTAGTPAVVQVSSTTTNNFTTPKAYVVTAADSSTATYTVTVTVAASGAKAITAYSLGGVSGTITGTAISVTMPFGTNVSALVATFSSTGTGVPTIAGVNQVSGTTANNFTSPKAYLVTAADGTTATYTVTVSVALNFAKALTAFSLDGVVGVITEPAHTIAVTMPFGTNVSTLVATFTSTGAGLPTIAGVNQVSGTTANNFTSPKAYLVTAADGTTATYTVTVSIALNSAKAITAYSLAGVVGVITEPAHTIAVTMPFGTNVTTLVATFTTTGAGVPTIAGVSQLSTSTVNDFTTPKAYLVTAADGTTATYNVTVTATAAANPTAPTLGEAGRFVILAPAAITTTGVTAISNGDIGISPAARSLMAGFTTGATAGSVNELTNGTTYAADDANPLPYAYPLHFSTVVVGAPWTTTGAMLTQANTDLGLADTFLAADPNPGVNVVTQVCPLELGNLTLTRGVYKTASNVAISTGSLTLDAQGDPNAVFIFNIGGTLTTGAPGGSIVLIGGALAKNVYWRTAGITTIGAGTSFKGLVFATTQVNVLAGANITGSLFAVTDRVTLIADIVTKAP